ncbi:hypothetical protein M0805_003656 [Coniferiporia weirii]|nr:hypothetical protein M0805_003656 [Coniferiporia weirii]
MSASNALVSNSSPHGNENTPGIAALRGQVVAALCVAGINLREFNVNDFTEVQDKPTFLRSFCDSYGVRVDLDAGLGNAKESSTVLVRRCNPDAFQPDNRSPEAMTELLQSELEVLHRLRGHTNIERAIGVVWEGYRESPFPALVFPMPLVELSEYVTQHPDAENVVKLQLLQDVASGLNYLHSQDTPVVHRNLKAKSVYVFTDTTSGHVKAYISNFMQARLLGAQYDARFRVADSERGYTSAFTPPEYWRLEGVDPRTGDMCGPNKSEDGLEYVSFTRPLPASDMWAFGLLFYEVYTGRVHQPWGPGGASRTLGVYRSLMKGARPRRLRCFSESQWKLVSQCWASAPLERPSANEAMDKIKEFILAEGEAKGDGGS